MGDTVPNQNKDSYSRKPTFCRVLLGQDGSKSRAVFCKGSLQDGVHERFLARSIKSIRLLEPGAFKGSTSF